MKRAIFILSGVCVIVFNGLVFAGLDDVRFEYLKRFQWPLNWYNIEGAPDSISGPDPEYHPLLNLHLFRIDPGREIAVRVPPDEMLRLTEPYDYLMFDDVAVDFSHGNGFRRRDNGRKQSDSNSILYVPGGSEPVLAHIRRPSTYKTPVLIAVFVSRRPPLEDIVHYSAPVSLDAPKTLLTIGDQKSVSPFHRIDAGADYKIRLKGPLRLSVEARYRYPARETKIFQNFQLFFKSRDRLYKTLDCETRIDSDDLVFAAGRPVVTGRLETMRFNIPEDVEITEIQASADLLIRFFTIDSESYLFSDWNSPADLSQMLEKAVEYQSGASIWATPVAEMMEMIPGDCRPASEVENTAMRILKDNERRDGALSALALMESFSRLHPEYPEIKQRVREMAGGHSFFRDLFPARYPQTARLMFNSYFLRRLNDDIYSDFMKIGAEQHAGDLLNNTPEAFFVELPEFHEHDEIVYVPPDRFNSSTLRIAVDISKSETVFEVCYDTGMNYEFRVAPKSHIEKNWFIPSPPEIGAAIRRWRMMTEKIPDVFGTAGDFDDYSPLIRAGVWELPLPPDVRRIVIRPSKRVESPGGLKIALQYRASKTFSLSETQFMNMRDMVEDPDEWFRTGTRFLTGQLSPSDLRPMTAETGEKDVQYVCYRELLNHLIPLRRLVCSRAESFTESVPEYGDSADTAGSDSRINTLIESARAFESDSQWICALEEWSEAIRCAQGTQRVSAMFERIRLLLILGEEHLAERQLKSIFVHSSAPEFQNRAYAELKRLYRDRNSPETVIALDAARLIQNPDIATMSSLVEAFVDNGDYEPALTLALLIPEDRRPVDLLLRACLRMDWNSLFHRLINQYRDESKKRFWLGLAASDSGIYRRALEYFEQAGEQGKAYRELIQEGIAIRNQIADSQNTGRTPDRTGVLRRWMEWRGKHPGPFVWRPLYDQIDDHGGCVLLYGISRNVYSTAFKATSKRPLRFKIIGSAGLRIEMRPIHEPGSDRPLNGWAVLRSSGRKCVYPIDRNIPVDGLINTMNSGMEIGRGETVDFTVGPGVHEVELFSEDFPMLVRIWRREPEKRIRILPGISFKTVGRLFNDDQQPRIDFITDQKSAPSGDWLAILPRFADSPVFANIHIAFQHPDIHMDKEVITFLINRALTAHPFETGLQSDCACCFTLENGGGTDGESLWAAQKSVISAMTGLAYHLENSPGETDRVIVEAWDLFHANRSRRGLKSIFSSIDKAAQWKEISLIQESDGVKHFEIRGWNPESPSLRVRKAMMPPVSYEDHILYDENRMALYIENYEATRLSVSMRTMDVGFLPAEDMTVQYSLDDEPVRRIMLTPEAPERDFTVDIAPGEHLLHVEILEKSENQVLKVNIHDPVADKRIESRRTILENIYERAYHVATAESPVVFEIEGPAMLRIDELRRGKQAIRYKKVDSGWEKIVLTPFGDKERAFFRVFQLSTTSSPIDITRIRRTQKAFKTVPEPLFHIDPSILHDTPSLEDRYRLGGQEDGLFSAAAGFHRRGVEEGESEDEGEETGPDEFFQIEGAYRYFDEYRNRYSRLSVLSRSRFQGRTSYGIIGDLTFQKPEEPLFHRYLAHFYTQDVMTEEGEHSAWSAGFRTIHLKPAALGLRTRHIPYVSLFFRYSSLNKRPVDSVESVDRDVFTFYKRDHKGGLRLGEMVTFRPWADTEWYAQGVVAANENLIPLFPDHVTFQYGWKQLIRDFQIDFRHQMTYYLEDNDRSGGYPRNSYGARVSWRRWRRETTCFEAGIDLEWVSESQRLSAAAFLSVYYGNGRGNRDFRPGEIDFTSLRKRRMYLDAYDDRNYKAD